MTYKIAGIDVHKKMLAVVIADVAVTGEYEFQRCRFGTRPSELREMAAWLVQQEVEEAVLESTAQYWRPVWHALEQYWQPARRQREGAGKMSGTPHLAQAESNKARSGRKNDFVDGERLVKRLVAQELCLSFVPDAEQRLWRAVARRKYQLTQDRTRLRNQLEGLLEEMHIKLTSLISDLFGLSGRRMLQALAEGERDPTVVAALADDGLRATQEELRDALSGCKQSDSVYRVLLKSSLEQLKWNEEQTKEMDRQLCRLLQVHQEAVCRLANVPGLGADSAQQIITQIGPSAAAFRTAKDLVSWVGMCPGDNVSAEKSKSTRCPKGNRTLRRVLNQAAQSARRMKGSIFELIYRRTVSRKGHQETIWIIAHRLCSLIWKILHQGVCYEERGPAVRARTQKIRTARMIKELRALGYQVQHFEIGLAQ